MSIGSYGLSDIYGNIALLEQFGRAVFLRHLLKVGLYFDGIIFPRMIEWWEKSYSFTKEEELC
jgi:hypothetical protein